MQGMIQVAGVHDRAEAEMLLRQGVTHIGLPLGPGVREQDLPLAEAAALVRALGGGVGGHGCGTGRAAFVLITYLAAPAEVAALCGRVGVGAVQLHGRTTPDQVRALRALAPELFIIKSLVVGAGGANGVDGAGAADVDAKTAILAEARAHAPHVDAFLTDSYDPATRARGATGKGHDLTVDAAIVRAVDRPVILAGGLHSGNVAAALRATGAAGVDAHTGLEGAGGRKDPELVRRFVSEARSVLP